MAGRNGASDQRGRLVSDPFDYRIAKDGAVIVSRGGRPVTMVGGRDGPQRSRTWVYRPAA